MSAPAMHTPHYEVKLESRGGETVRVKDEQTKEVVERGDRLILKANRIANDPSRPSRKDKPRWWRFW